MAAQPNNFCEALRWPFVESTLCFGLGLAMLAASLLVIALFNIVRLSHGQGTGPTQCYGWSVTTETSDMTRLIGAKVWLLEKVPLDGRGEKYYRQIVGNGNVIEVKVGRKEVRVESDCCVEYMREGQTVCGLLPAATGSPTPHPTKSPTAAPTAGPTGQPQQYFAEMSSSPVSVGYNNEASWSIEHVATGIMEGPYNFSAGTVNLNLLQGPQKLHMHDTFGDGWNGMEWSVKERGNGDAGDISLSGPFTLLAEEGFDATRTFVVWDIPSNAPTAFPTKFDERFNLPTLQPTPPPTGAPTGDAEGCGSAIQCTNDTAWQMNICRDCRRHFESKLNGVGCKDRFWKTWPIDEQEELANRQKKETLDLASEVDQYVRDPNHIDEAGFFSTADHGRYRERRSLRDLKKPNVVAVIPLRPEMPAKRDGKRRLKEHWKKGQQQDGSATVGGNDVTTLYAVGARASVATTPSDAVDERGLQAEVATGQAVRQSEVASLAQTTMSLPNNLTLERHDHEHEQGRISIRDLYGNVVGYEGDERRRLHLPIKNGRGEVIGYTKPHRDSMSCGDDTPYCIAYSYTTYVSGMYFGTEFGAGNIGGCSALNCEDTKRKFESGAEHDCGTLPKPPGVSTECPDDVAIFKDHQCYTCQSSNCNDRLANEVNAGTKSTTTAPLAMALAALATAVSGAMYCN
jgi:hypothetical protein